MPHEYLVRLAPEHDALVQQHAERAGVTARKFIHQLIAAHVAPKEGPMNYQTPPEQSGGGLTDGSKGREFEAQADAAAEHIAGLSCTTTLANRPKTSGPPSLQRGSPGLGSTDSYLGHAQRGPHLDGHLP